MMPLSYHTSNVSLIALETMRLLVQMTVTSFEPATPQLFEQTGQ